MAHLKGMWRASIRFLSTSCFRTLFPLAVATLLLPACSKPAEENPDIIILHTGRMRGNVYPLSLQSIAPLQHYQYLAGYIRQVREEAGKTGASVLVVDLGDSLEGSFASHVTKSENMVTFFNDAGYDAIFLSNLDNAVTPESLAKLKAKVLNPFQNSAGEPATKGTSFGAKVDAGKIPVYLLANFYGEVNPSDYPDRFPTQFGTSPTDVKPLRDYTKTLAALGDRPANSLTLLSWMKFESPKTPPEGFLEGLRKLDVSAILAHRIYGGKEKDVWTTSGFYGWNPPVSLNILRNNGGFALARLDLKREGESWKVLRHQLLPMTANTAQADKAVTEALKPFAKPISDADTKLGDLPENVDEEVILRIYLTALSTVPGTDVALYSKQSIRSDWPAGELRASQVFNSLPWTTPIVQLSLSPEQIAMVEKELSLSPLQKAGLSANPATITTSQYFGRLIASKLGLPPEAIRESGIAKEFDYFSDYLKSHPEALNGGFPPAGWSMNPSTQP
jgi:hypothetical protein